ncbi:MAG: hypothetical protein WC787_04725 [Patescibacteria group bacterium]|jgi:hypothetical protein
MEAGNFFRREDSLWRIDAASHDQVTVRRLEGFEFGKPWSLILNFDCEILSKTSILDEILPKLIAQSYKIEEGSREGILEGNDFSGSSSYTPSVIVKKEKFAKTLCRIKPEEIDLLLASWGVDFVREFFLRLPTLGGYYEARWEEFDPSPGWYSGPLCTRGSEDERKPIRKPYVQGSLPDESKYHDQSKPEMALPHLRRLKDKAALALIAQKAKCEAVRIAAKIILSKSKRAA